MCVIFFGGERWGDAVSSQGLQPVMDEAKGWIPKNKQPFYCRIAGMLFFSCQIMTQPWSQCVLAAVTSFKAKLDPVLAAKRIPASQMSSTEWTPDVYVHFSGVCLVCLNLRKAWLGLRVFWVDWEVLSREGDVLGAGAGWKDILDNGHHTVRLIHTQTLESTHARSLNSSNNRDNTVSPALF